MPQPLHRALLSLSLRTAARLEYTPFAWQAYCVTLFNIENSPPNNGPSLLPELEALLQPRGYSHRGRIGVDELFLRESPCPPTPRSQLVAGAELLQQPSLQQQTRPLPSQSGASRRHDEANGPAQRGGSAATRRRALQQHEHGSTRRLSRLRAKQKKHRDGREEVERHPES